MNAQANNNPEVDLIQDIASFWDDPYGFVMYAFPWGSGELKAHDGPDEWQKDILCAIRDEIRKGTEKGEALKYALMRIAVASGHDIGKSALIAWLALWAMSTWEDCRGVVTANTERQLRSKTWPEIAKWHRLLINKHWFDVTATAIISKEKDHDKTWRIDAIPWSENNTEAFAGLHNEGKRIIILFDEASAIADRIWEVTEGATLDSSTQIIWCVFGNPTLNVGRFKDCFGKYRHRWVIRQIDSRNCKISNKELIKQWEEDYGEDSDFFKVRVRGMFPSLSTKQFISLEDIDAAYGKYVRPESYSFAPVIIGCDPAWEGDDELVIVKRQGLFSDVLKVLPKNDNDMHVAALLAHYEDAHKADAVFIDGGYGTGIISAGRTLGRNWQIVWFGGASSDPGCENKRAEMYNELRLWLKSGGAIPQDPVMHDDLMHPEILYSKKGKIMLESKKDMKARGLPSPGRGDALALTFAFPVVKTDRNNPIGNTNNNMTEEYSRW